VQLFHDAAGEYPKLAELIAVAREGQISAGAVICDVLWSFYKACQAHSWIVESGDHAEW